MKIIVGVVSVGILLSFADALAGELAVITNKSFPLNHITVDTLKEIYKGEKTIEKGVKIHPLDQKEPVIKKKFLSEVIGTSLDRYNTYWIKRVFQEGGIPPTLMAGSDEVLEAVVQETGAIGYVWRSEASGRGEIKILLTIEVSN